MTVPTIAFLDPQSTSDIPNMALSQAELDDRAARLTALHAKEA
jgi:hypothetical protein